MSIADRVVLVTGATGALGREVAHAFASTGVRLVITGRRLQSLVDLGTELQLPDTHLMLFRADLGLEADVTHLMESIAQVFGGVDILLNVAGGWAGGERLADLSVTDWQNTMTMNLTSAFLINRAVLPHMEQQGWGRIINVASRAAVDPGLRQAAYNVSKAGVVALTASIARDYRLRGITANVLLPSIIDTPANRSSMPDGKTERWIKPQELAEMMLFLCSDAAASINGAAIPVYGAV